MPSSVRRAPTTWSNPSSSLTMIGDLVVGVRHVDVGPHDDAPASRGRAGTAGRARPSVLGVADQPDALDGGQVDLAAVVGSVVDDDDLERVGRREQGRSDAVDLLAQVAALVVDGQDHADVEQVGVSSGCAAHFFHQEQAIRAKLSHNGNVSAGAQERRLTAGSRARARAASRGSTGCSTTPRPSPSRAVDLGDVGLEVRREALLGEVVGMLDHPLDAQRLDRPAIRVERHRPGPVVGDVGRRLRVLLRRRRRSAPRRGSSGPTARGRLR